jgi:hypothetical protein
MEKVGLLLLLIIIGIASFYFFLLISGLACLAFESNISKYVRDIVMETEHILAGYVIKFPCSKLDSL